MILLDLLIWICDHWEEVTLNGVLLLLLRKFIMSEVHKLLYLNRDEEIRWMRDEIEGLTGRKWNGQQPIWKRVETRYIKNYYSYLRKISKRQRRVSKMKSYLKKLGKTKFQAFLIITFTNIIMLIGSVTGWVDIDGKINEWMPAINLVVQLIATLVYTSVEGSIDKANIQASSPNPSVTVSTSPSGSSVTLTGGQTDAIPTIDTDSNK